MDDEIVSNLDYGSNIAGLGLLLNAEKVSNSVNLEDIEKKVKSMYSDDIINNDDDEDDEDEDPMREFNEAMEEVGTIINGDEEAYRYANQ